MVSSLVFAQVLALESTFRGYLGFFPWVLRAVNCRMMDPEQTVLSLVIDTLLLPGRAFPSPLWWRSTRPWDVTPQGQELGDLTPCPGWYFRQAPVCQTPSQPAWPLRAAL